MADEKPKFGVEVVQAIEEGGEYDDTYGIINLRLTQGTLPLAFTAPQLLELLPQLSGLAGKLKGAGGVVWRAEDWRVAQTLDGSLRLDFSLQSGATISVSIPMAEAAQVVNRIQAESAKAPDLPLERKRH